MLLTSVRDISVHCVSDKEEIGTKVSLLIFSVFLVFDFLKKRFANNVS